MMWHWGYDGGIHALGYLNLKVKISSFFLDLNLKVKISSFFRDLNLKVKIFIFPRP
jgi:hypothetical protein